MSSQEGAVLASASSPLCIFGMQPLQREKLQPTLENEHYNIKPEKTESEPEIRFFALSTRKSEPEKSEPAQP